MGTFWKCVLVKFVLNEFVLTKDLVYFHQNLQVLPSESVAGNTLRFRWKFQYFFQTKFFPLEFEGISYNSVVQACLGWFGPDRSCLVWFCSIGFYIILSFLIQSCLIWFEPVRFSYIWSGSVWSYPVWSSPVLLNLVLFYLVLSPVL